MTKFVDVLAWSLVTPEGEKRRIMLIEQYLIVGKHVDAHSDLMEYQISDCISPAEARDWAVIETTRAEKRGFAMAIYPHHRPMMYDRQTSLHWLEEQYHDAPHHRAMTRLFLRTTQGGDEIK